MFLDFSEHRSLVCKVGSQEFLLCWMLEQTLVITALGSQRQEDPSRCRANLVPTKLGQPELRRTLSLNRQISKLIASCAQEMPVFPQPGFIFKRSVNWSAFPSCSNSGNVHSRL